MSHESDVINKIGHLIVKIEIRGIISEMLKIPALKIKLIRYKVPL